MAQHKLVIAEKPSVAQSLAAVIGATVRKDGYLEGNGWRVSWCVGHLAGLADADSYDPKYAKSHIYRPFSGSFFSHLVRVLRSPRSRFHHVGQGIFSSSSRLRI